MAAAFATSTASPRADGNLATEHFASSSADHFELAADVDSALRAYIRELEELFVALRGRGLLWSRDDVACATAWWQAGVALTTARRVLEGRVRAQIAVGGALAAAITLRSHDAALRKALGLALSTGDLTGAEASNADGHFAASHAHHRGSDPALDDVAHRAAEAKGLAASAADPALAGALASAGKAMARRLADADADGPAVLAAGRQALRRRLLKGIGASARADLDADVDGLVALGVSRSDAYEMALSAHFGAPWPDLEGWRLRPTLPSWRPQAAQMQQVSEPPGKCRAAEPAQAPLAARRAG